jgi:hypothetical protein
MKVGQRLLIRPDCRMAAGFADLFGVRIHAELLFHRSAVAQLAARETRPAILVPATSPAAIVRGS